MVKSKSEETHAEDLVVDHHFRSQQMIQRLSWRSILETLATQDVVAGEEEVTVGMVDVQPWHQD